MNLYESIKTESKPNLVYVKDYRVDIDSHGHATVWKDGKIFTQLTIPFSVKPDEYRDYLEYKLEDEDEYDYKSKHFEDSTDSKKYSLNTTTYTKIVRTIDDACIEEMNETEIQLFLQNVINHCRDVAESYNVIVETDSIKEV